MMTNPKSVGAYATLRSASGSSDAPELLFATDEKTLSKAITMRWVASLPPESFTDHEPIKTAILREDWGEVVQLFMAQTGQIVDFYPNAVEIADDEDYPDDEFSFRVQMSPLFEVKATAESI